MAQPPDTPIAIPFNRPSFPPDAIRYLEDAVRRGATAGNGPYGRAAEEMISALHGTGASTLLTTSGTHALELSARLAGLEPGDEVIVPAYTFVSTASAFVWNGALPVLADVRRDTLNIDPVSVERMLGPRTKAICIVHYGGVAADPEWFRELADERDLILIEDNAHGLGGSSHGRPLGTFGHMSATSFHETKNINCGEGGALTIHAQSLIDRAEILREKGTNRVQFQQGRVDKYTWVDVGSSWVISDLLAGVLCAQLERFTDTQAARQRIWAAYAEGLGAWGEAQGILLPHIPEGAGHTAHMFHLRMPDQSSRDAFIAHMRRHGILCVFHYQALSTSAAARELGLRSDDTPTSIEAGATVVRLPFFDTLTDDEVARIVETATAFRPGSA